MRRTLVTLGMLALASWGAVGCGDTAGITNVQLGFTIAEGLLLLSDTDPTLGTVVFASNPRNCKAFQAGATFNQILLSDFLTFTLQAQDTNTHVTNGQLIGALPLTAGTYNIEMGYTQGPGLFATSIELETDPLCNFSETGANSGTVTVQPFNPDAGASSTASATVVFGLNQFMPAFPLTTCILPSDAGTLDAGSCLVPGTLI